MGATMVPEAVQHRSEQRFAAKVIRANAGVAGTAVRTTAVAEIGAAARRLRASNRWNETSSLRTHRPVAPVAPIRVVRAEQRPSDAQVAATKRVHPAGGGLPQRLRLV